MKQGPAPSSPLAVVRGSRTRDDPVERQAMYAGAFVLPGLDSNQQPSG